MRLRFPSLLFVVVTGWALAAGAQVSPSPKLEPLPEPLPPPPPPQVDADSQLEPQVTVIRHESETIEEYRVKGRLTMVKVTPQHGRPYYLVPSNGADGPFVRRDSLDSGLRVPLWLLYSF